MLHKLLSCLLITVLLGVAAVCPAHAKPQGQENLEQAGRVKAKVGKLFTRRMPRVRVKLNDGRKLKGYISEAKEDYFVVVDPKVGTATTVRYAQVKELDQNHSRRSQAVGVAVVWGILILAAIGVGTSK